jgi:phage-related protein
MSSYPTFSPPMQPSAQGTSRKIVPRVLATNFGDGYVHRIADGINTQLEEWTVTWSVLLPSQSATIQSFFASLYGCLPFTWTPPNSTQANVYICSDWTESEVDSGLVSLSATIVQTVDYGFAEP